MSNQNTINDLLKALGFGVMVNPNSLHIFNKLKTALKADDKPLSATNSEMASYVFIQYLQTTQDVLDREDEFLYGLLSSYVMTTLLPLIRQLNEAVGIDNDQSPLWVVLDGGISGVIIFDGIDEWLEMFDNTDAQIINRIKEVVDNWSSSLALFDNAREIKKLV